MVTKAQVLGRIQGWPRTLIWNTFRPVTSSQDPTDPTLSAHVDCSVKPINPRFKWTLQPDSKGLYRFVDCAIKVSLNSAATWVVTKKKTTALLSHEQGHYDIAGLVAVDLCRAILETTAEKLPDLKTKAQDWITTYDAQWSLVDDQYDASTHHGDKKYETQQRLWKAAIQGAIDVEAYGFGALAMCVHFGRL